MTDRLAAVIALCTLLLVPPAFAAADEEELAPPMEAVSDLVEHTSRALEISRDQARSGLGVLFSHARAHLSATEFREIARAVENMDELLAAAPATAPAAQDNGGLFGGAAPADASLRARLKAVGLPASTLPPLVESTASQLEASSPTAAALLRQTVAGN